MNDAPRDITELHTRVDRHARRLELLHDKALQCRRGCHDCCIDDITVFAVEAQRIAAAYPTLLATDKAHPAGACAFLDAEGGCRIYDARPYVCRTQGLPLRWIDEHEGELAEFRDICPLNDDHVALTELPEKACWTLGDTEVALQRLQHGTSGDLSRVSLRALFANG